MAVSYNKLWKLLVDRKMSKADLRKLATIAPNTMTKLRRDEEVTLGVLGKICKTLDVDYGDIMEYVNDSVREESVKQACIFDSVQMDSERKWLCYQKKKLVKKLISS